MVQFEAIIVDKLEFLSAQSLHLLCVEVGSNNQVGRLKLLILVCMVLVGEFYFWNFLESLVGGVLYMKIPFLHGLVLCMN